MGSGGVGGGGGGGGGERGKHGSAEGLTVLIIKSALKMNS